MALLWKLCKHGHEKRPENIVWVKDPYDRPKARCRECQNKKVAAWKRKKYAEDAAYRADVVARASEWQKERYNTDAAYRADRVEAMRLKRVRDRVQQT